MTPDLVPDADEPDRPPVGEVVYVDDRPFPTPRGLCTVTSAAHDYRTLMPPCLASLDEGICINCGYCSICREYPDDDGLCECDRAGEPE